MASAEYHRAWRAANREKVNATSRSYYAKNREKCLAVNREWMAKNKDRRRAYSQDRWASSSDLRDRAYVSHRQRIAVIRAYVSKIKMERGCMDCGYKAHAEALDLDHVRGVKRKNVSQCTTIAEAADEMALCDVVCANCHRVRHALSRKPKYRRLNG
jgi:hypothetical protein